jgi:hypothetical protein
MDGWRAPSDLSPLDRFERAKVDLSDIEALRAELRVEFVSHPGLMDRWQGYCEDRRGSPAPVMKGCRVWHYDQGVTDEVVHEDRASACSDYVTREAAWVLDRRRVVP